MGRNIPRIYYIEQVIQCCLEVYLLKFVLERRGWFTGYLYSAEFTYALSVNHGRCWPKRG